MRLAPRSPRSARRHAHQSTRHLNLEFLEDRTLLSRYFTVDPAVNISRSTGDESEATIVVDPTNPDRLFAASNPGMFARYSVDGGQTWQPSNLAGVPASCCDNQAVADPFGNLFVVYLGPGFSSLVAYSTNFGQSFAGVLTAVAGSTDQPSIGVGGSDVPGEYTVWVSVDVGQNGIRAAGARVRGLGQITSFSTPQLAPGSQSPHGSFGGTSVGPNGEVLVTYQKPIPGPGPGEIYVNTDPDGLGPAPFGPAVLASRTNVGGFAPVPPQPNRTIDAEANLAWDRSGGAFNGRAYLVYTDRPSVQSVDTDIYVRYSDDNGATWSDRIRVNDDATTNTQFNPAIAVDQTTGHVAVSWYDPRNIPANNAAEVWASASLDGGLGWLENVKISLGITNCIAASSFNCGDYDTMDFHGGYFYRIWADNSPELPGNPGRPRHDTATARVRVGQPAGPYVTAHAPRTTVDPDVGRVRVTFNVAVDPASFSPKDVSLSGPLGKISITKVVPVKGSGDTQFELVFPNQGSTGQYNFVLGPDILDVKLGMPMDQDFDGKPGEPEDIYRGRFNISGLRVTGHTPTGQQGQPVDTVRLTFSRAVNPKTLTAEDLTFTGPGEVPIKILALTAVEGSKDQQFDVSFAPQGVIGLYRLVLTPDVRDLFENPLDQNGNLVPGEDPADSYTATFTLLGPRIINHTPTGGRFDPVSTLQVTFNRPMDPKTFTLDDVVSFLGPAGGIPLTSVTPVKGSEDRVFEFTFEEQTIPGNYTLVFGPDVLDAFQNPMDQNNNQTPGEVPGDRYTATFQIADVCIGRNEAFGYLACVDQFFDYSIVGQPGTFVVLGTGTDLAGPVNLGTNRFTFYGTTYTGNNRLFVSNKGLITFGAANLGYTNTDLSVLPQERAIAVLWDDWVKPTGTPSVLGLFVDFDEDGTPDALILEWNQVVHHPSTPSGLSFQAWLFLNSEGSDSVLLNYLDLDSGNPAFDNGGNATVGIKDTGTQGNRRILVAFNNLNSPYLGSGKSLLISHARTGPGSGSQPLDGNILALLTAEEKQRHKEQPLEWTHSQPSRMVRALFDS